MCVVVMFVHFSILAFFACLCIYSGYVSISWNSVLSTFSISVICISFVKVTGIVAVILFFRWQILRTFCITFGRYRLYFILDCLKCICTPLSIHGCVVNGRNAVACINVIGVIIINNCLFGMIFLFIVMVLIIPL